jgi:hypothetical protein
VAALALTRAVSLFGVSATDPATFAAIAGADAGDAGGELHPGGQHVDP